MIVIASVWAIARGGCLENRRGDTGRRKDFFIEGGGAKSEL
jgi:hypothetical protein